MALCKTIIRKKQVVFVEVKPKFENEELLNPITQVIVEWSGTPCNIEPPLISQCAVKPTACDWNNAEADLSVPIYGILCNGNKFQFFTFNGRTKPHKVSMGVVWDRGSPFLRLLRRILRLVDFSWEPIACAFFHSLRLICETVFNFFLLAYIASLKAFRHGQQKNLDGWDQALKFAEALEKSQDAEALRQDNSINDANATTENIVREFNVPYKLTYQQYRCGTDCQRLHQPTSDGWLERRGCESVRFLALCGNNVILAIFDDGIS
ncbi:hypothetical protein EDB87DRAFT_908528 [Lactarius vividus]|nr:hypothetical protein EDB87DRAFT_908528 [Lactarius vividus]